MLADPVLANQVADLHPSQRLLQDADDLLLREPAASEVFLQAMRPAILAFRLEEFSGGGSRVSDDCGTCAGDLHPRTWIQVLSWIRDEPGGKIYMQRQSDTIEA